MVTIKIAIQTVKQSFLYITHLMYCNVNVVIVLQCFVLNSYLNLPLFGNCYFLKFRTMIKEKEKKSQRWQNYLKYRVSLKMIFQNTVVSENIHKITAARKLNTVYECKVYFPDYFFIDIELHVVMKPSMETVHPKLQR